MCRHSIRIQGIRGEAMRTELKTHGIVLSDDLRAAVHHETERLAQALRRRISSVTVELFEQPTPNLRGHAARCRVDVLFEDGSRLGQVDEEDDCYRSVSETFVKILCERTRHQSRLNN
jgi:ribosome-associated translation inhibitor RaiA